MTKVKLFLIFQKNYIFAECLESLIPLVTAIILIFVGQGYAINMGVIILSSLISIVLFYTFAKVIMQRIAKELGIMIFSVKKSNE